MSDDGERAFLWFHGERVPVVKAYFDGSIRLKVWCDHCGRYHLHGAVRRDDPQGGHRGAHCHAYNPDSPYLETGYWLDVVRYPAPKKTRPREREEVQAA